MVKVNLRARIIGLPNCYFAQAFHYCTQGEKLFHLWELNGKQNPRGALEFKFDFVNIREP